MTEQKPRTGGRLIVDALQAQGVDSVFCVPGESYLAVLDALHDAAIAVTVCRQEGGAAIMAEAAGKLTGRPGIAMVTRGPGATNASHGIHIAQQDSTPMILFIGQVERGMREREAFQEVDYKAFFGSMTKWVVEIDRAERIPELIARAFRVAMQGRPGPVVIALPEDVLTEEAAVADAARVEPAETWPGNADMMRLQSLLWAARSPLVIAGGSGWSERAVASLVRFAERFDLPVATSFRRQMLFPADHPNYAGDVGIGPNPKLAARVKEADLLVLAGGRMSEMPSSSYTLIDIPTPRQTLVHVHAGAEELGRVYQPALAIHAGPKAFAAALEGLQPPNVIAWSERTRAANAEFHAWTDEPKEIPGAFQYGAALRWLRERLPEDAIICNGAGNYAIWVQRYLRFRRYATQLAPTSGSMGYGVPAAVAAKTLHRDRMVVCFAGDGCFLMNGQEFATAVQYELPIIVVVVDNGMYGTIRMHQERHFPGRVSATMLKNPDFRAYAEAFGGHGERVETTAEFAPAFERALASGKPAILHCRIDPEAITPAATLTSIREAALKG
ncbi:thiamine pyrophosphate-binding protein [Labrys wisconsinensis]|uniref:Acetolactate synthase-1/2/3 large subunit n=1 Tax=Labrys wisconsinensis TaxID=425677 RepID=A0ABU0JH47_9HYPH|nr:thiamine pyrophosphate-binding protein [Labrys wisconsinensis]MDQ0472738.1 acetolactate synthase-1/2/3 large subunit [Labrys wisconsinensis]